MRTKDCGANIIIRREVLLVWTVLFVDMCVIWRYLALSGAISCYLAPSPAISRHLAILFLGKVTPKVPPKCY